MQFWFLGAFVGLDEDTAGDAVRDCALKGGFEAGAAAEDCYSGHCARGVEAVIAGALGGFDFCWDVGGGVQGSVIG